MTTPNGNPQSDARHEHLGRVQLAAALFLIGVGAGLLIAGFIVSPLGEIHSSVLISVGEILTFVGALFGIDYRYKSK